MNKCILMLCVVVIMGQNVLCAQNVQEISFKKKGSYYELFFSYYCNERFSRIFTEDTTLALNIKEFFIDGEQKFPEGGNILVEYIPMMKTQRVRRNESEFFISTGWLQSHKGGWLSDNERIRCIEWMDLSNGYSYIIPEGSKTLLIHYNVILPFPDVTIEKLVHRQIPEGYYTEDYWVKVNLDDDFIL